MNEFNMILQAYDALDELKTTIEYQNVIEAYQRLTKDSDSLQMIETFNQQKKQYDEVTKFGKHHPDFQKISTSFIDAKTALYSLPEYLDYVSKLRIFNDSIQNFTDSLNELLKTAVINSEKACKKG